MVLGEPVKSVSLLLKSVLDSDWPSFDSFIVSVHTILQLCIERMMVQVLYTYHYTIIKATVLDKWDTVLVPHSCIESLLWVLCFVYST